MLQLIISILLSLGLNSRQTDGGLSVNQDVINQLQSTSQYSVIGGDDALNSIVLPDDVDPHQ